MATRLTKRSHTTPGFLYFTFYPEAVVQYSKKFDKLFSSVHNELGYRSFTINVSKHDTYEQVFRFALNKFLGNETKSSIPYVVEVQFADQAHTTCLKAFYIYDINFTSRTGKFHFYKNFIKELYYND